MALYDYNNNGISKIVRLIGNVNITTQIYWNYEHSFNLAQPLIEII